MMADLPYMMMNWGRFFTDAKVAMLPAEAQGVYALLLGRMWLNEGWISADDRVISRQLGLDVRRWKTVYKPLLVPLLKREIGRDIPALLGDIYTQKHLQEVRASSLDMMARRFQSTARARAAKAAKARHEASVAEHEPQTVTGPAAEPTPEPVAASVTTSKPQTQKKGEPQPPNVAAVSPFLQTVNGAEHDTEDEPASDPALVQRLVSDGLRRTPDRSTLFGALQARQQEEDDA